MHCLVKMKTIENYQIPYLGQIAISEESGKYNSHHLIGDLRCENILLGCETRGSARRSAEGYLISLIKNEKIELGIDCTKSGWLRQFQVQTQQLNVGENK